MGDPLPALADDLSDEPTLRLCWNTSAIRRAAEVLRAAGLTRMASDVEAQLLPAEIEALVDDYQRRAWDANGVIERSGVLREFALRVLEIAGQR